jgi:S1-C subfamily serine protease
VPPGGYGTPGGYGQPPQQPRRGGRALIYVVVAALAAGVGAGSVLAFNRSSSPTATGISPAQVPSPAPSSSPSSGGANTSNINAQAIANAVEPGVVDVISTLGFQTATAEGTGIIISSTGSASLILTNNHVVDGATSVKVTLPTAGKTYPATVVGADRTDDVALLKVAGVSGLHSVKVGNSDTVRTGDAVVAIGNAGGQTVLQAVPGTVTALNQQITASDQGAGNTETLSNMIQTNAQIVAGDSGGPMVNASSQVIGIDTAANSQGGGFDQSGQPTGTTTGFAIPINKALSIAQQIAAGQSSSKIHIGAYAFIGVSVANLGNAQQCQGLGFGYNPPVSSGALVCNTVPSSPAASSGLAQGDVITSMNGKRVASADALTNIMNGFHPGDKVTIGYVDSNGQRHTTSLTLTVGPAK